MGISNNYILKFVKNKGFFGNLKVCLIIDKYNDIFLCLKFVRNREFLEFDKCNFDYLEL